MPPLNWAENISPASAGPRRTKMTFRSRLALGLVAVTLIGGEALVAQRRPAENVSGRRHPNLAAAQRLTEQAFQKISEAQRANEFDMNGHAARAKELLDQANNELKQAAQSANTNRR
jgi:hypothetical protein